MHMSELVMKADHVCERLTHVVGTNVRHMIKPLQWIRAEKTAHSHVIAVLPQIGVFDARTHPPWSLTRLASGYPHSVPRGRIGVVVGVPRVPRSDECDGRVVRVDGQGGVPVPRHLDRRAFRMSVDDLCSLCVPCSTTHDKIVLR